MKTIITVADALPYIAGLLVFLVCICGRLFVYQPSFSRMMSRRSRALLELACRAECLQGAYFSGEILWMLQKLSEAGDSALQARLTRKEYRLLMSRFTQLRQTLQEIRRSGYTTPLCKQLDSQRRGTKATYSKVMGRSANPDIDTALFGPETIWRGGLAEYRMLSGIVDFGSRCLALIKAKRTSPANVKYLQGAVFADQLLWIEGLLFRVVRDYLTTLDNDQITREAELYCYLTGTFHYLSIPFPTDPSRFYLSSGELSGLPSDDLPSVIVVMADIVLEVPKGEEENYRLWNELEQTTCEHAQVCSRGRQVYAVKLVRWTGERDRVSAFMFADGRRSVVYERQLKAISDRHDRTRLRAPVLVITD